MIQFHKQFVLDDFINVKDDKKDDGSENKIVIILVYVVDDILLSSLNHSGADSSRYICIEKRENPR